MRRINIKLISWVVLLNLILGFIPIASAQGKDAVSSADHCALSFTESSISMFSNDIDKEPVNYCHDSSDCVAHYGCAPLRFSSELAVSSAVVGRKVLFEDTAIYTRYPAIPERPPKNQDFSAWKFSGCASIERLRAREVFTLRFFNWIT